jgi:hypothetical protein
MFKDVIFYEDHFGFAPITITISIIVEPCITPLAVPLLNLKATLPWLAIVDEFDMWGDPTIGEESSVPEASLPSISITHFDQQDEDSSLLGNATLGLNRCDEVQNSKSQYDILPPITQLY